MGEGASHLKNSQNHQEKEKHQDKSSPITNFVMKTGASTLELQDGLSDPRVASTETILRLQRVIGNHAVQRLFQRQAIAGHNQTGLPDRLKTGIEHLSGYSMNDVHVHYNSDKPAQLRAEAFAQGADIHVASCQERHLGHEAWHVVQQRQGRVQPTVQMTGNLDVNDDAGLESEADVMGTKALQLTCADRVVTGSAHQGARSLERAPKAEYEESEPDQVGASRSVVQLVRTGADRASDMQIASQLLDGYLETHVPGQHMDPDLVANFDKLIQQAGEKDRALLVKFGGSSSDEREKAMKETDKVKPLQTIEAELSKFYKDKKAIDVFNDLVDLNPQFNYLKEDLPEKPDLISIMAFAKASAKPQEAREPKSKDKSENTPHAMQGFWLEKGADLLMSPMARILLRTKREGLQPMWCDQATAITIATLQADPKFKASLEVIKQGDPKQHGHWYVLANRDPKEAAATYGQPLTGGQFIIDIWGALRLREEPDVDCDSCVFPEGNQAVLNAAVTEDKDEAFKQNLLATLARFEEKK
jgi:uncharacterized protein DUF4157